MASVWGWLGDAMVSDDAPDAENATLAAVGGVSQQVTALSEQVQMLAAQDDATEAVVLVNDGQWQSLMDEIGEVRQSLAEISFVAIACLCVCAALLGNRLWVAFSEGWR